MQSIAMEHNLIGTLVPLKKHILGPPKNSNSNLSPNVPGLNPWVQLLGQLQRGIMQTVFLLTVGRLTRHRVNTDAHNK